MRIVKPITGVHCSINGHYRLSRELNQFTLYDLAQILPYRLPNYLDLDNCSSLEERWNSILQQVDGELRRIFTFNLEQFFQDEEHQ